jgi:hypothetical protein
LARNTTLAHSSSADDTRTVLPNSAETAHKTDSGLDNGVRPTGCRVRMPELTD